MPIASTGRADGETRARLDAAISQGEAGVKSDSVVSDHGERVAGDRWYLAGRVTTDERVGDIADCRVRVCAEHEINVALQTLERHLDLRRRTQAAEHRQRSSGALSGISNGLVSCSHPIGFVTYECNPCSRISVPLLRNWS